ncbi:MAG: DUF169 domain-containing protein [Deltaproteobacteria bacterium]|nr:DUF169 domain-containing protein [Deltaproteobacteria bacterium]
MNKYLEVAEKIREFINPDTFPVAVGIFKDASDIPPSAKIPIRDLKAPMAPCQGTAMARRYGWTVAFTAKDVGCAIAAHTYGWKRIEDNKGAIRFLMGMNYVSNEDAAHEVLKGFRSLDMGDSLTVVYSPLQRTKIKPDVVLIYCNPAQLMRLIHGATHSRGKPITCSFSGRAASCTEGVIGAYLDGECKVVIPGNGDRVWATCQDHEVLMAIPAARLWEVVEGIELTHKKGIRYPIPSYIRYSPEVAFTLPLSDIFDPERLEALFKP